MIFILVLLVLVGVAVLFTIKASYSAKSDVTPETIDLKSVRDALMEKLGWSLERAEAARGEYIRFLTLLRMRPGFMLVPWASEEGKDDVDQFWHQHILDTAKYVEDCNRLFGRMIHHNPHVVRGSGQEAEAVTKTQQLYARTFYSENRGSVNTLFLAGCGGSETVDACSSADGGHGDAGHSCGGHGCGHGCGGH